MNQTETESMYRRFLKDRISLVRIDGIAPSQTLTTVTDVRADVKNYAPSEINGVILQGDQFAIVLKSDLVAKGFPIPPAKGDRLIVGGRTTTVQACDPDTRKIGTELIAYEIRVRG